MPLLRFAAVLVIGACAGCSTLCAPVPGGGADSPRPFADVPNPPRCDLVWSYAYESGSLRYGTWIYEGRPDTDEVVDFYKRQMPREDWRYDETVRTAETVLRYAKGEKQVEHCDITIGRANWLGNRYVIVTVTGSYAR